MQQNAGSSIYSNRVEWICILLCRKVHMLCFSPVLSAGEGEEGRPVGDTVPRRCGRLGTSWDELALRTHRRDSPEKCAVPLL